VAQAYMASLLPGKKHLARRADGGLLCKDAIVARSGVLEYGRAELGLDGAGTVQVFRPPEEVSSRRFLASIEGIPVTDQHPGRMVDPTNFAYTAKGHATNARVGPCDANGNLTVLADLIVGDDALIGKIERGLRDTSIGFRYEPKWDGRGRLLQTDLVCNHVALVERGRAGTTAIQDAAPRRSLVAMAEDFLGKPIGSVKPRAFDSREETIMNDVYDDDLIPVPAEPPRRRKSARDEALRWLREIRPQVVERGTRPLKDAWNALYRAIRDGENPELALANVRRQFSATDRASTEDDVRRVANDFVRTCASYLGQDVNEVANERKTRALRRALADSKTTTESFVNTCAAYLGATDIHEVERKLRKRD
jgi:hypothetical protein